MSALCLPEASPCGTVVTRDRPDSCCTQRATGSQGWNLSAASPREESPSPGSTVDGRDFVSTSTVKIGDRLLRTELVSPAQLRASIPAELVKKVGTYPVKVVHRMPGWGETNTVYLIVKFR